MQEAFAGKLRPLDEAKPIDYRPDGGRYWVGRVEQAGELVVTLHIKGGPLDVAIPKTPEANNAWRSELLEKAEDDPELQATLRAMCASGGPAFCFTTRERVDATAAAITFWLNLFGWTFRQNEVDVRTGRQRSITSGETDIRWVTWPVQEYAIWELVNCIERGLPAAMDKCRDMGATWLTLAVFVWYFLFRPNTNFMVVSRNAELVDNAGDPDSCFFKIDFILENLPWWMKPPMKRKSMSLSREVPGEKKRNSIVGKSTTGEQGRGGRKTAVLVDEASLIRELQNLWVSLSRTTDTAIAVGTAYGPVYFADLVEEEEAGDNAKVVVIDLPYWDHPEKGAGRYGWTDPASGIEMIRSPWFDREVETAVDILEINQEILRDHQGSGMAFFSSAQLRDHARAHCRPPLYTGDLVFDEVAALGIRDVELRQRNLRHIFFDDEARPAPWHIWSELELDERTGLWRPPQQYTYIIGGDVGFGVRASNSTMYVHCLETRQQVGAWSSAVYEPSEFARLAAMAGLWWGGARGFAFWIWEANGAGENFGDALVKKLHYPWFYYHREKQRKGKTRGLRYGWYSNLDAKKAMVGRLRSAMAREDAIIRDQQLIDEAKKYIHYDGGSVGPSQLVNEGPAAKKTHGDRVIAGSLAVYGAGYCHQCDPPERHAPVGSPAERRQRAARRRQKA